MVDYAGDEHGGKHAGYPLDPDIGTPGMPYLWDFRGLVGTAGEISSYAVSADSALTVASDAKGNATADSGEPGDWTFTSAASGAKWVQVKLYAAAGARNGNRYRCTVTATDANGTPWPMTMHILVADR